MGKETSSLDSLLEGLGCSLIPVSLMGAFVLSSYLVVKGLDEIEYLATGQHYCDRVVEARGIDYSVSRAFIGNVVSVDRREILYSECDRDGCILKSFPYDYLKVIGKTGRTYYFASPSPSREAKPGPVLVNFNPTLRGYALESALLIHAKSALLIHASREEKYCVDESSLHLVREVVRVHVDGVVNDEITQN